MAILKCKICGGDMSVSADKTFGTCEYCGSTMTLPKIDDEQRADAFNRGNHFRRIGEFDKALSVYERIVEESPDDAEAHWCCALCRFGIEWVEDPVTMEYLPTCHRASFDIFTNDVDYLAAVEFSDGITKKQYIRDGAKISEVQKGILATSQNEEPFDVFICYKESDESGNRTVDSTLAQDIYYQLTEQGLRVFFARITLEDKVGSEYEPYIFAALNSAKVMVAVGTKSEHFNAVWVKNEWSRFLSIVKHDRSKVLLPCYKDMDPYDLPEQLSVLQSYDMGKIGFMQDLIRGIKKVCSDNKIATVLPNTTPENNTSTILDRAFICLEAKEWRKAYYLFEEALKINPRLSDAYLGKCMVDLHITNKESIIRHTKALRNKSFILAFRFADGYQKRKLQKIVKKMQDDIKERKAKSKKRIKAVAKICLISILCISIAVGGYIGYIKLIYPEIQYNQAQHFIENEEYDKAIEYLEKCEDYKDSAIICNYYNGLSFYDNHDFKSAMTAFEKSKDYKDSIIKLLYSTAYFEFNEREFESALKAFDSLIKKGEKIDNLKEYNYCKGFCAENIPDKKRYWSLCGDYEIAEKALDNLNVLEKIQGKWKEIDSSTVGFLYRKMTITNTGGVYSESYKLATGGTETEDGTIELVVDDQGVELSFWQHLSLGSALQMWGKVKIVNNNRITLTFTRFNPSNSIFVRTS